VVETAGLGGGEVTEGWSGPEGGLEGREGTVTGEPEVFAAFVVEFFKKFFALSAVGFGVVFAGGRGRGRSFRGEGEWEGEGVFVMEGGGCWGEGGASDWKDEHEHIGYYWKSSHGYNMYVMVMGII